jgi:DNA/RNA-binding domain of Phe-tRNA-synthetase-like protein
VPLGSEERVVEEARATAGADPVPAPPPQQGWVAPHVASEFPGLGIAWIEVDGRQRRSSNQVRRRLRDVSDRFFGAQAIHMRERPIPWAYRVFFRQIGLDPDRTRTPVEQLALERLQEGAFLSRGMPVDAMTIATIETGVALRAFDADRLEGGLCIRDSAPGEMLPDRSRELAQGTLTVADERTPVGLLFGGTAESREVSKETRRIAVVAVQVNGVPQVAAEEALWIAAAAIESS